MTLTAINFFLLVVTKKNLTLTFFRIPLNFLSAIFKGEISLKEAEISQRNLVKK